MGRSGLCTCGCGVFFLCSLCVLRVCGRVWGEGEVSVLLLTVGKCLGLLVFSVDKS